MIASGGNGLVEAGGGVGGKGMMTKSPTQAQLLHLRIGYP